jgi:hypothetical protein
LALLASDSPDDVGTSNPAAQAFADDFTRIIPQLELADAVYADLHNLSNLAVATALIADDQLYEAAGWDLSWVLDETACSVGTIQAPAQAESIVNYRNKGRMTIILGGGVSMQVSKVIQDREPLGDTFGRPPRNFAEGEWSIQVEAEPDLPPRRSRRPRQRTR